MSGRVICVTRLLGRNCLCRGMVRRRPCRMRLMRGCCIRIAGARLSWSPNSHPPRLKDRTEQEHRLRDRLRAADAAARVAVDAAARAVDLEVRVDPWAAAQAPAT